MNTSDTSQLPSQLHQWFSYEQQQPIVEQVAQQVGMTRTRAEYFVKLWVYLLVKQQQYLAERNQVTCTPPLQQLELLNEAISCSHSEAARLFYGDKDEGSDRAAGNADIGQDIGIDEIGGHGIDAHDQSLGGHALTLHPGLVHAAIAFLVHLAETA